MKIKKEYLEWMSGNDAGISSKTMMSYILGINCDLKGIPHDMADVGRCVRMLRLFPELREKLSLVIEKDKEWMPYIDCWKELERRYDETWKWWNTPEDEQKKLSKKKYFINPATDAYRVMQELRMASLYVSGMRCQNSSSSWQNKAPNKF